ncbi:hypothetical protein ACH5RR_015182 [Cinchona calisaya]|uniref:Uncharacterized protein n=1 Tax=Cinchona calisaya TaxID=153742 RepID=A0ABD2ZXP9_9GENT
MASLFEFFPKGYFGQVNKIESSFVVTSHQEIATGELSAHEETDLVVNTVKGLPTWLNLSESMQLPEEDQKALVKVLEDPSKYKTILDEIDGETTPCTSCCSAIALPMKICSWSLSLTTEEVLPVKIPLNGKSRKQVDNKCELLLVREDVKQIKQTSMIKEMPISKDSMAPQIFKYIPKAQRRKGELSLVEISTSKISKLANKRALDTVDRGLLEKPLTLLLTKQHTTGRPPFEGFVKSVRDESLPTKLTTEGFDSKTYRLTANAGIDYRNSPSQVELNPEVTGLRPLVFYRFREPKDYESKPEGSSQKSVFERIGSRDIKVDGEGLKRLRKKADDGNEIHRTVPSRMMCKIRWGIQTEEMLQIRRRDGSNTKYGRRSRCTQDRLSKDKRSRHHSLFSAFENELKLIAHHWQISSLRAVIFESVESHHSFNPIAVVQKDVH